MAWHDENWTHRKAITVASAQVAGALTNFQVRVRVTGDTDIAPKARFDGRDLLVTASDETTKLPHALVRYDPIADDDWCWTWFNGPVSVHSGGATYIGGITSAGDIKVRKFVHATGTWTEGTVVAAFQADDHNNPALCVRSDGKLLALVPEHNGTTYAYVSDSAGDVSAWTLVETFAGTRSYANIVKLGSGRIFYFFRDGSAADAPQSYQYSNDGGETWSTKVELFNLDSERPYAKYSENQNDATRIDVAVTDGHPNEVSTNSVYHFYLLDDGSSITLHASDGTALTAPATPSTATKVYDGTTNRGWVWDIATDASGNPAIVYTVYVGGTTDQRYRYAKWNGLAWVDNQIATVGDTYALSETYYSPGICLDRSDPSIAYLVRLTTSRPVQKYVTADSGGSWTASDVSNKGSTARKTLRPVCPLDAHADIPVVWLYGVYTNYLAPDYATALVVPYGPACTSTDIDLYFKADSLSDSVDSTFYLYYGNGSASAQEDVENTFPDDVLVVPGGDVNWEQLDLIVPGGSVDKEPSGSLTMVGESGGTNGDWQRHGGAVDLSLGTSPNFAGATAFTLAMTVQPQSGGGTTQHILSNFSGSSASGLMFRYTTADMQPAVFSVREANTQIGGKFSDVVLANDTKRRWYATGSTANGLRLQRDLTLSATSYAMASAMDATASAVLHLGSSPHVAQRYRGYLEAVRLLKDKEWTAAEKETEYNNHTSMATFFTLGSEEAPASSPAPAAAMHYYRLRV